MRYQTRPDGTELEILEVTHCATCGEPFELRRHTMSWLACLCAGGRGHRTVHCLRPGCHGITYDPPHVIQHGPTASYD
jgi:hypothetical protein